MLDLCTPYPRSRRCVQKFDLVENLLKVVIRCRVISNDASRLGSVFICGGVDRRLDESTSTTSHRISHRGESGSWRTDRQQTDAIHRRPAPSISCKGQKTWSQTVGARGDYCDTGNADG